MRKTERSAGFTLLEVLVALAIIGLGLVGVFGQMNQSITTVGWLRDKTLAHWVAVNFLTEQRLLQQLPAEGRTTAERELAGVTWKVSMQVSDAALEGLREVEIDVATAERPTEIVTTLYGALSQPLPGGLAPGETDWFLFGPSSITPAGEGDQ